MQNNNKSPVHTEDSWDCNECQYDIRLLATEYGGHDSVTNVVNILQGDAFCKSRLLNLEYSENINSCQNFMGEFMPAALELLMEDIKLEAQQLCFNIFDEVCQYPK